MKIFIEVWYSFGEIRIKEIDERVTRDVMENKAEVSEEVSANEGRDNGVKCDRGCIQDCGESSVRHDRNDKSQGLYQAY